MSLHPLNRPDCPIFLSISIHLLRLGRRQIAVWRTRGRVPHAADLTASFAEALLSDANSHGSFSHQLQLAYSMAFVRFVNGLVDPLQASTHAMSIARLAAQLNLPSWFVDLRHAATHDRLPSLSLLRSGAKQALEWLAVNYWDAEEAADRKAVEEAAAAAAEYALNPGKASAKSVAPRLLAPSVRQHAARALAASCKTEDSSAWTPLLTRLSDSIPGFAVEFLLLCDSQLAPDIGNTIPLSEAQALQLSRALLEAPQKERADLLSAIAARFPSLQPRLDPFISYLSTLSTAVVVEPNQEPEAMDVRPEITGWTRVPAPSKPTPIGLLEGQSLEELRAILDMDLEEREPRMKRAAGQSSMADLNLAEQEVSAMPQQEAIESKSFEPVKVVLW